MATKILYPSSDVYIAEYYPDTNFANSVALFVGQFASAGDDYRSLIKFDLNQLEPTSTISSAKLKLYVYTTNLTSSPTQVSIYRLIEDFDEQTVTWNTKPAYDAAVVAVDATTITSGYTGWVTFDITSLVQDWHSGAKANNGLLIRGVETANNLVGFRSNQYTDSDFWAKLEIVYNDGILDQTTETITLPGTLVDQFTTPKKLGVNRTASFIITNTGAVNPITLATIQYSNDGGLTWFDTTTTAAAIATGATTILTTDIAVEQVRLKLTDAAGAPTTATVITSIREA
ncbi:DNRLRE domain-containing protein [Caloranaerobacter sp. DY30410]|uniref:DNRLRE domain-containing protein n=1 Tax=Caloranaerobacter sp. DY30410 TaxID=3238305 RepID=UPI003CFC64B3